MTGNISNGRYGRFDFWISRRSTDLEEWLGFGCVPWAGVAVLALGPLAFNLSWPVRLI
ncbi:MAG: hypothetical protein Q8P46_09015 [Hyphomicrobiales bacterium]|nr:hypothetical protein [Hyphomicrobiales bacterium]